MKGTPPFTRHPVEREFIARAWAGHRLELRHAEVLASSGCFHILEGTLAVWLVVDRGEGTLVALRLLEKDPHVSSVRVTGKGASFTLRTACLVGDYEVRITLEEDPVPMARATVRMTTRAPVKLDRSQREVLMTDRHHEPLGEGLLFTTQTGPTAGQAFVASDDATLFYFQNLTALGTYSVLAGASLEGCVGVEWPALGMRLPEGERPLPKGVTLILSDAFLRVSHGNDGGEAARAVEFMDALAWVYRKTAPAPGRWFDWHRMAERTLEALGSSKQCVRRIRGRHYLNAYVGSDDKPPESMVRGALEVPLVEYESWQLDPHPLMQRLAGNLEPFYSKELKVIGRWLTGEHFHSPEQDEEAEAQRMDSWYLLHTMMNLGRLAELGKRQEKKLFFDSLDYVMKAAAHFDHDWPVFYDRKTLKALKREVKDGLGGERDAAGLYAHVMLQAWHLTADRKYLDEAEVAASKLVGLGFGMLYQTNNTVTTAVAMARLWRATGNVLYKELGFVCMASVLSHLWLWEPARPGNTWSTYMALPPLHDAPYIAPYEEAEVLATSRAYLEEMGEDAPESLVELWVEYGKQLAGRARFYLPAELPPGSLCGEPREGVIVRSLPVPVEDLYPSMAVAGQVGQEVYGAGLALILTTRTFYRWRKVPFMLWCAAPLVSPEFIVEGKRPDSVTVRFSLAGPAWHRHELRIIPSSRTRRRHEFKVWRQEKGKRKALLKPAVMKHDHLVFEAAGSSWVEIVWRRK